MAVRHAFADDVTVVAKNDQYAKSADLVKSGDKFNVVKAEKRTGFRGGQEIAFFLEMLDGNDKGKTKVLTLGITEAGKSGRVSETTQKRQAVADLANDGGVGPCVLIVSGQTKFGVDVYGFGGA